MKQKNTWNSGKFILPRVTKPKKSNSRFAFLRLTKNFPSSYVDYYQLSLFLTKFFNSFIRSGKKHITRKLLFKTCLNIRVKTEVSSKRFFNEIIRNVFPLVVFKTQHVGHIKHEVPTVATLKDQVFLSVKWITESVNLRKERSLEDRVFNELLEIFNNNKECASLKKKKLHYSTSFANKSFVRYLK